MSVSDTVSGTIGSQLTVDPEGYHLVPRLLIHCIKAYSSCHQGQGHAWDREEKDFPSSQDVYGMNGR